MSEKVYKIAAVQHLVSHIAQTKRNETKPNLTLNGTSTDINQNTESDFEFRNVWSNPSRKIHRIKARIKARSLAIGSSGPNKI